MSDHCANSAAGQRNYSYSNQAEAQGLVENYLNGQTWSEESRRLVKDITLSLFCASVIPADWYMSWNT